MPTPPQTSIHLPLPVDALISLRKSCPLCGTYCETHNVRVPSCHNPYDNLKAKATTLSFLTAKPKHHHDLLILNSNVISLIVLRLFVAVVVFTFNDTTLVVLPASAGGSLTASGWGSLLLVACTSRTRGALAAFAFLLEFAGLFLKFTVWRLGGLDLD